ncbi:MAG: endo-1,4-beta-xylanase [Candidatus Ratteibacteria bacterium]|nr:endo-1,4-beta-xylanase [Candidatus Ratteibacteria bacterium]
MKKFNVYFLISFVFTLILYPPSIFAQTSKGTIRLDTDYYLAPASATITVEDSDLDLDKDNPDTVTVEVTSDIEYFTPKVVTLTETGDSTGIFTGSIKLTNKFLGNIIGNGYSIPSNFGDYWNQVSPENAGKWGCVEATRDVMQWEQLDLMYDYAKEKGLPFRLHTFVWGQQQPGWMLSHSSDGSVDWQLLYLKSLNIEPKWLGALSLDEQREEVEEWIRLCGERYPDIDFIDVVNEPLHAPPSYKDALDVQTGYGDTDWDWVIWSFQKARQYCPNAKLHINEYNVLEGWTSIDDYLEIINLLKDRGLIDGIGHQCHNLQSANMTTVSNNLDKLAATGLPVYITELDVVLADDAQQLNMYQQKFSVFWEHPSIGGITLWGYIQGTMWLANGYLIRTDETERPALTWLKEYTSSPNGILRVKSGDTVTATYVDADDGEGNFSVIVTAAAGASIVEIPTGFTATTGRTYVFLRWNTVDSSLLAGYNIYRSDSLTGTKAKINDTLITNNFYQNKTLAAGTTYYYWIVTVDNYGNETDYSNTIRVTTLADDGEDGGDDEDEGEDGGNGGSGGGGDSAATISSGCFIATACYGTPMAKEVKVLSEFRDEYLMDNSFGRIFVSAYYKVSPQIASYISENPCLKSVVRLSLKPVVKCIDKFF